MEGWLSGRVTTDKNFTFFKEPKLDENAPLVPAGPILCPRPEKTDIIFP